MSRIAQTPIVVPNDVEVTISSGSVSAKGPKGQMSFDLLPGIGVIEEQGVLNVSIVTAGKPSKKVVAMSGTARALLYNLIYGVSKGFEKMLRISGIGYRAQSQGNKLNLSLGFSHPIAYSVPSGVSIEVLNQTEIIVRGMDKQQVGQVAAEIRAFRPPEPYKGKGIRYQDEYIKIKQAKKK